MTWQDAVLSLCSLIFIIALVPSLRSASKPHVKSCVLTGIPMLAITTVYVSLGLWFSALTAAITAGMWFALAAQQLSWRRARSADQPARAEVVEMSALLDTTDLSRLESISAARNVSSNEAIRQALATEAFVRQTLASGRKVLVEDSAGQTREIEFSKWH